MLAIGKGIPQDRCAAAVWYTKAAEQGVPEAQFVMGEFLRVGDVVERDAEKARYWYERARANGYEPAAVRLRQMAALQPALVPPPTRPRARTQAAAGTETLSADIVEAAEQGRRLYQARDFLGALRLLLTAAEGGHPAAQYGVGIMYFRGEATPKDERAALRWFLEAAQGGIAQAQHEAAVMLFNGVGCERDPAQAFYWSEQAAAQGHVESAYNMAMFLINGVGAPRNSQRALEYLKQAASLGHAEARLSLARLCNQG